ncbi:MAG: hypothetical protein M3Z01_08400 [Thermoproteota archaeon]|nr:hypothetical protein [Thermoproteota archaeon]
MKIYSEKITAITAAFIITIIIIDLLTSRQLLQDGKLNTNTYETIIFILTVSIGYGIGSFILLTYTGRISRELRPRSQFINIIDLLHN